MAQALQTKSFDELVFAVPVGTHSETPEDSFP
jgi:hypothetical protein